MTTYQDVERLYTEANEMLTEIYNDYKKGEITAADARSYIPLQKIADAESYHDDLASSLNDQEKEKLRSLRVNTVQTVRQIRSFGGRRKKTARRRRRTTRKNH